MYILALRSGHAQFYEAKVDKYSAIFIEGQLCKSGNCHDFVFVSLEPNMCHLSMRGVCFNNSISLFWREEIKKEEIGRLATANHR